MNTLSNITSAGKNAFSSAKEATTSIAQPVSSGGTEKRGQILPSTDPQDTGFILPNYDFASNLVTPKGAGVKEGGSFGDVYSAAQGVAYYLDTIGFGASSSFLTRGKPFKKMGINFFMKSGLTCTNGADMWTYFEGIPNGSALGKNVQNAMRELNWPQLQGLAPGIIEDAKDALDIRPVINAAFGSVYPVCEQQSLPVGDDWGQVQDPKSGDIWVKGPIEMKNGRPYQTRWVQKVEGGKPIFVTRGEFEAAPKTQNPDGTPKGEGFEDGKKASLVLAITLVCLAVAAHRYL